MSIVEMSVHMDCAGCQNKIRRALQKLDGVDEVDIDMARQKVTVMGYVDQKKVLKAVRKTGRRAVIWPYAGDDLQFQSYNQGNYYHQHNPLPAHHLIFNSDPYSYNYYKHGYDRPSLHGYYQAPSSFNHVVNDGARTLFSDDNPNACSIM